MDIFISQSGPKSHEVASVLHRWLPKIVNAFKPWLSSKDIDKGTRWRSDIAGRLEHANAGIICLTPSNLHADWILFEAGALSKQVENTFVCPLLIGLEPADVKGPLAEFQATRLTKPDVLQLLKTLNTGLGQEALPEIHIDEAFEVWWPRLETELKNLPSQKDEIRPQRTERDLLEEVLDIVRNQSRGPQQLELVHSTGQDILTAVRMVDPEITQSRITSSHNGYIVQLIGKGGKQYGFTVAPHESPAALGAAVAIEMSRLNNARATVRGTSSVTGDLTVAGRLEQLPHP